MEMIWCNFGVYFSVVSIVLVLFASKVYTQSINVFSIGVYYGTSVFTLCFSISPSCALLLHNTCQVCMISVPHGSKVS